MSSIASIVEILDALHADHVALLSTVDGANSRVVTVEVTSTRLQGLGPRQRKHLEEALGCVRQGYYRAAIVTAWSAVVDRILGLIEQDGFVRVSAARPRWTVMSRDDLTENYTEHAIIDAFGDAKFVQKSLRKTLQGQLHTRNQAAHPTSFDPTFNTALGFVDGVVAVLADLDRIVLRPSP